MSKFAALLLCFALVGLVALSGTQFMPGAWYAGLAKPSWTPPNWVFGPAWTILYVMIAVAGWLVVRAEGFGRTFAIWAMGLVPNALWSYLMFGRQAIGPALADIIVLWLAIVAFIVAAARVSLPAAALYVPYLAWVTFASALNFAIWRLNG